MMDPTFQNAITSRRENILYSACSRLAEDLMMIDPFLYAMFFQFGEARVVCEEISDTIDHHFRPGTMTFACTGESQVTWDARPVIAVDLEFVSEGIFALFQLVMSCRGSVVDLKHISFSENISDPDSNTTALKSALDRARV